MPDQNFFFDTVDPMFAVDGDTLTVVVPDEDYPGHEEEWHDGFRAYLNGYPATHAPSESDASEEAVQSWIHGYATARMAELLGAELPQHLSGHDGDAKLRRLLRERSEQSKRRRENPGPPHSAEHLCPYDDETKREAWIAGFRSEPAEGVDGDLHQQGTKAWEALHDVRDEQPMRTNG